MEDHGDQVEDSPGRGHRLSVPCRSRFLFNPPFAFFASLREPALVRLGEAYLRRGVIDFEEWSERMSEGMPDEVQPYLQPVYQAVLRVHREGSELEPGEQ